MSKRRAYWEDIETCTEEEVDEFRSAIEWPEFNEDPEEPTGELKQISAFLMSAIETIAIAHSIAPECESPIEIDFGVIITKALLVIGDPRLSLKPQYVLGPFRYDFAILREGKPSPLALIECDGKEFHESKEQIENDRVKDKEAAMAEVRLFRFSGSQIFRDVDTCVAQVVKFMAYKNFFEFEKWRSPEMSRWN